MKFSTSYFKKVTEKEFKINLRKEAKTLEKKEKINYFKNARSSIFMNYNDFLILIEKLI